MILKIRRNVFIAAAVILLIALAAVWALLQVRKTPHSNLIGGTVHTVSLQREETKTAASQHKEDYSERYQRPSRQAALKNPYSLQSFTGGTPPDLKNPQDVIYAYYGILKEASNMSGYSGGCGTIGNADIPYPYAYDLLTSEAKKSMSPQQFKDSFRGIGHITLLQMHPLPAPPGTPAGTEYYMVEIEAITGQKENGGPDSYRNQISYFEYYYGIVTTKKEGEGWKIEKIDYLPEEFLCAPYHGWFYDAGAVVQIIYSENLKIIDKITEETEKDGMLYIYATGGGKRYRFDFIRLTNGHDILTGENILENGQWVPTSLLTDGWKDYKFSIENKDFTES